MSTTVWELAETTKQPLEVVIFHAVAYEAWNPGGHIDDEWAATLVAVLGATHPWRRAGGPYSVPRGESASAEVPQLALEGTEPDPASAFAAEVLANLGSRVPVRDHAMAERLARAGLGDNDPTGFSGYPDEAATWSQLAHGTMDIEDLDTP